MRKKAKKEAESASSGRFRPDLCGFMPIFPGKDALLFGKRCLCLPEKVGSFSQDIRYFSRNGGYSLGKTSGWNAKMGFGA